MEVIEETKEVEKQKDKFEPRRERIARERQEKITKRRKKIESNVKEPDDIQWDNNTGNPFTDSVVIADDLTATIEYKDTRMMLKSPSRRLMKDWFRVNDIGDEDEIDNIQESLLLNMYPDLTEEMMDDMNENEYDLLGICMWEYHGFLKRKSEVYAYGSYSRLKGKNLKKQEKTDTSLASG